MGKSDIDKVCGHLVTFLRNKFKNENEKKKKLRLCRTVKRFMKSGFVARAIFNQWLMPLWSKPLHALCLPIGA